MTAAKAGQVEFRAEKAGIVHAGIGKASFEDDQLLENARAFVEAIQRAKPTGAKGTYVQKVAVSSSMGPGVKVDVARSPPLSRSADRSGPRPGSLNRPCKGFAHPTGGRAGEGSALPNLSETAVPWPAQGFNGASAPPAVDGVPRNSCRRGHGPGGAHGLVVRLRQANQGVGRELAAGPRVNRPEPFHKAPVTDGDGIWTARKSASSSPHLATVFADTSFVLVAQNKGLTVAEVSDLRRRMRDAGATYKVAKNRLATLALDGTRFQGVAPLLKGPTALAWSRGPGGGGEDGRGVRQGERQVRRSWAGRSATQTSSPDGVKALSELPSLDTLRAQLLGLIQTPATRIAGVLQAPGSQLARVFSAFAEEGRG